MATDNSLKRTPRKGCVDVFNEFMLEGLDLAGYYRIPIIKPTSKLPEKLIPFSEAISSREKPGPGVWVHFYEDDVKFERFWRNPKKYADVLRGFEGFISPDYSLYADFTPPQKIWNTHRNYASGAWLQQARGFQVLPNVRTSGWDPAPYALAGAPHNSPIAIGSHGCLKNRESRASFIADLRMTVDALKPSAIIVYGTDSYGAFDYPRSLGIPIKVFPSEMQMRLGDHLEL